jgi:hypothetical protein
MYCFIYVLLFFLFLVIVIRHADVGQPSRSTSGRFLALREARQVNH